MRTVTSVNPATGLPAGGTTVTITGDDFTGATDVSFGLTPAAFTVDSPTQITATSPTGTGTVDVLVTGAAGTSPYDVAARFTYQAAPSPDVLPPEDETYFHYDGDDDAISDPKVPEPKSTESSGIPWIGKRR